MTTRLANHPGLTSGFNFTEFAYSTGNETWPVARVRVTPEVANDLPRMHQPNGQPLPQRVSARLSASLVDDDGQVMRIGGRLLLGTESIHSYQFDAAATFDPVAWLDGIAAAVIAPLLRLAAGMAAANAAGLLPAPPALPEATADPEQPPSPTGE